MSYPTTFYSPGHFANDNMGGVWYMRYALAEWITNQDPPLQNVCTTDLTFDGTNEEAAWRTLPITPDTGDFQESLVNGPNGTQYRATYTCFLGKIEVSTLQLLQMAQRFPQVVEVQDNNGLQRRIGDVRNPCRVAIEEATGGQASARNGFTLSLTWLSDEPIPFVDTTYVADFAHLEDSVSAS